MKAIWIGALCMCWFTHAHAQGFWDIKYKPFKSGSVIQDKDFYLFTLFEQPPLRKALKQDTLFRRKLKEYKDSLIRLTEDRSLAPQEAVKAFIWAPEDVEAVAHELQLICLNNPSLNHFLMEHLRRSGYWIRSVGESDTALISKAWTETVKAEDKIILNYSSNKGFRYAAIDSATFSPNSAAEREMLGETLMMLRREQDSMTLFFQPGLELALHILFINDRDEPARFEPLDSTNKAAYQRISVTDWRHYHFSAILVPGEGPEDNRPMSPVGKYRCQLAAEEYRRHKAPFIIVSGGYVHPFHTPYCEAEQMMDYLLSKGIPRYAIIMEPQARHTTTNFRNANRIILRKGFPAVKRVLCVSTSGQVLYMSSKFFAGRCQFEMGYVPYTDMKDVDAYSVSYLPDPSSLQMDAADPLDP